MLAFYSANGSGETDTNAFILAQKADAQGVITIGNLVVSDSTLDSLTIKATFFGNDVAITNQANNLSEMRFVRPVEVQVTPWETAKIEKALLSLSNEKKELTFTAKLFSQAKPVIFTYDFATDSCAPVSFQQIAYNVLFPNLIPDAFENSFFDVLTISIASPFTASVATIKATCSFDQIKNIMPCSLPTGELSFSGSYGKSQGLVVKASFKGDISVVPNIATISNVIFTIQQNPNDITSNTSIVLSGDGTLIIPGFGSPMRYKVIGRVANGKFDYMQGIAQGPITFVKVMNVKIVSFEKALVRISLTKQNIRVQGVATLLNDLVATTNLEVKQVAPKGKLPYFYIQLSEKIISKTAQALQEGSTNFFQDAENGFNSVGKAMDNAVNSFKKLF